MPSKLIGHVGFILLEQRNISVADISLPSAFRIRGSANNIFY